MFTCDFCGKEVENVENINDYNLCEECIENDEYRFCADCGKMIHVDDAVWIDDDYYCYDCHETCNDCGCVMTRENAIYTNYSAICSSCYESDYISCQSCGEVHDIDDAYSLGDEWYCEYCYKGALENIGIHEYGYKPNPCFNSMDDESEMRDNNLHVGIELEIQGCSRNEFCQDIVSEYGYDDGMFYLKVDGSLTDDGVEIVSQPMTYNFITQSGDWKFVFDQMKVNEMNDTEGCGLHFHLDRNYLNENMIATIDYIVNHYNTYFEKFCGRQYNYYCRKNEKQSNNWGKNIGARHDAVNLTNGFTVELRFCKSTCDWDTFIQRVRLIFAIVEFAKNHNVKDCIDWGYYTFLSVFNKHFKKMFGEIPNISLDK